ncbi:hypothetical protein IQ255_16675 [Pleurocapsales cyanobacterium LEGE 10410]|nr:hypothetical protein [Pleurocapsales cyanobacterium LEGE 10410]
MNRLLGDINTRIPSLQPFTKKIKYDPAKFNPSPKDPRKRNWRGYVTGWPIHGEPPLKCWISDRAFSNTNVLNRTVRHEIWHLIQRHHPAIYGPSGSLREFDAHLRDLENRHGFRLNPAEKFLSLKEMEKNWRATQTEPHWKKNLKSFQRSNFQKRYNTVLKQTCNELKDTEFRTHKDYSRICGPVVNTFPYM